MVVGNDIPQKLDGVRTMYHMSLDPTPVQRGSTSHTHNPVSLTLQR